MAIMRRLALLAGAGAALTLSAVAPAAAQVSAATRARSLLRGHMFTRFTESGVLGNSLDQRLHLCSSGEFIYDTVSDLPEAGTTTTNRVTGRWRVVSASFSRDGRRASALVRGVPDGGQPPLTVRISRDARGTVTIDGLLVDAQRSDLCS